MGPVASFTTTVVAVLGAAAVLVHLVSAAIWKLLGV